MTTEIATVSGVSNDKLRPYSSLEGDDMETRKRVFKAIAGASPLQDNLDKAINVVHIVRMPAESVNEATGELDQYMRTILIDDKENAFVASSVGVDISFQTIISTLGEPRTWGGPIAFVAKREGKGTNKYLTLTLA